MSALRQFSPLASRLSLLVFWARRIFGMPDYAAHLAHLRTCHPDAPVPTEREYFDAFVRNRYGDGPTRCC